MDEIKEERSPSTSSGDGWVTARRSLEASFTLVMPPRESEHLSEAEAPFSSWLAAMEASLAEQIVQLERLLFFLRDETRGP